MEKYSVRPVFYQAGSRTGAGSGAAAGSGAPVTDVGPGAGARNLDIRVPGSKSITNRALMLAAMTDGLTVLDGILLSDDSRHFISCLKTLGFDMELDEDAHCIKIHGCGGSIPRDHVSIDVGSAGTAARFLTALLGCSEGSWHLTSSEQMMRRPMAPLIDALKTLGCSFSFDGREGFFPFTIHADGIHSSSVSVDIGKSSQFLSALLMACTLSSGDIRIHVRGSHGLSYVRMTTALMKDFGIQVEEETADGAGEGIGDETLTGDRTEEEALTFLIRGGSHPKAGRYQIEPDLSAAAYFYAMAAISGGSCLVRDVHKNTLQGDIAFLGVLEQMGCHTQETEEGILVTGPAGGSLKGVDVDMGSFSDQALTLAAIAPFTDSPVTIRGISHIRLQECDRIEAILENMKRMGIRTQCSPGDVLTIYPGDPRPAQIETYDDHRVAISFALTGLRAPGIVIKDPLCCRKTFENYFQILDQITGRGGQV